MKRFFPTLAALTLFVLAAGSQDTGDLAAALSEEDFTARTGALIMALERAERTTPELARALDRHLDRSESPDDLKRLEKVWRSRPADLWAVSVALPRMLAQRTEPGNLSELLRLTLNAADPAALTFPERQIYFVVLGCYLDILKINGELPTAAEFCDRLIARAPAEPGVALAAARIAVLGCFMATDIAPGLHNWSSLAASDPWKVRLERLRRNAKSMRLNDRTDAAALTELAMLLHDRKLLEEVLRRRAATVGMEADELELMVLGMFMEMPQLGRYAPAEKRALTLALSGDPAAAEKALAMTPSPMRNEVKLVIWAQKENYAAIRDMVMKPDFRLRTVQGYGAACTAAVKLRDTALMERIVKMLPPTEKLDPTTANTVGYCAADMEYDLQTAEKLVARALRAEPGESAYLDSMAWLKFRQKKYPEASRLIRRSLKKRMPVRDTAVIFLHAADIELAASGDKAAARAYLDRAEKMAGPNHREFDYGRAAELRRILQ